MDAAEKKTIESLSALFAKAAIRSWPGAPPTEEAASLYLIETLARFSTTPSIHFWSLLAILGLQVVARLADEPTLQRLDAFLQSGSVGEA